MKVTIINNQSVLIINKKKIEKQVKTILRKENISTDEVILHFVDDKTIKELHLKFFNDPTITDCISFPIDPPVKEKKCYHILGEAFICTKEAVRYSKSHNISPNEELILYIIHCILHLIGYDDINKKDINIMRKKENLYISLLKEKKIL
jgi:probable rRNA maturation factor